MRPVDFIAVLSSSSSILHPDLRLTLLNLVNGSCHFRSRHTIGLSRTETNPNATAAADLRSQYIESLYKIDDAQREIESSFSARYPGVVSRIVNPRHG
jgi:hypothetical protein